MESVSAYIPMDRRQAIVDGATLPHQTEGAALFADISGFTPLTEALHKAYGPKRGPEELTNHLNIIYDSLVTEVHRYGGSVMGFAGDAITCWFDGDDGLQATACGLAMQAAISRFAAITIPRAEMVSIAMKAAVASGPLRRFLVGSPNIQYIDALAGATLSRMADAEHQAEKGEVVLSAEVITQLGTAVQVTDWRTDGETGHRFGVVAGLTEPDRVKPKSALPDLAALDEALTETQTRPWLLPPVYERLRTGQGDFLAELRPAVILFLRFDGIDYDTDEMAGDKLDTYVHAVQAILNRYEAYLLQLIIGDKGCYLYSAFGAPIAHEDDARRAVSAALELHAMSATLDFIDQVQIGISQGQLRTGAYGGTMRRTYGVLGDAVNLAARLMQAAKPGQTIVEQAVQKAAAEPFIWESLPDIQVKGKTDLITIFSPQGRQEAHATRLKNIEYTLPMVGRETELALIEQKLTQVVAGQGQIVGLTAEAGLGKSRLMAEIVRLANNKGLIGYGGECQSYGAHTSYLVWQSIWRAFFELDPAQTLEDHIKTLQSHLAQLNPALIQRLPLLGAVLNLTLPDNDLTRAFDAKLRKTSLEALLTDCLGGQVTNLEREETGIFLLLEDCHWLDPLSNDLLAVLGRAIANLPVLIVLAYRPPETQSAQKLGVAELPHFTEIQLTDFTPAEAERLINLKLAQFSSSQREIPPELGQRIMRRAQGNPFYIEELLNYLHGQGLDPQDQATLAQLDLPANLRSLILSRMDQLSEHQKSVMKVASVVGRLFTVAWLWGIYPELGDPERIKADLTALARLDLTPLDTPEPELRYLFKHIITQEVAYESLPYATRSFLHDQVGQFIERTYNDTLDQYLDLLAYHYEHSQNEAKKRTYLLKAGEAAQAEYANEAAINYYRAVLPLLPAEEQMDVFFRLGQVLDTVGQWTEAETIYRRALELAQQADDQPFEAQCQMQIGELFRKQSDYSQAEAWFDQAQTVAERISDRAGVARALGFAGILAWQQGDYATARKHYENSLSIRRDLNDQGEVAHILNNLGVVARSQGEYTLARSFYAEALMIRRSLGDKWKAAISLSNLGNVALDQGDYAEARRYLEEAVTIQREVGHKWFLANVLNNLGNVAREQSDYGAAGDLYEESLRLNNELGDKWALAYLLEDIGSLAAMQGETERPLQLAGAAAVIRETIRAPLSQVEQDKLDQKLEPARQTLGAEAVTKAWQTGQTLTLEQAVELALDGSG